MAPRHTQGCGGAAYLATAHLSSQQTKNWCVGLIFPPPAYAGIRPTLFLFGFRADGLNSHLLSFLNATTDAAGGSSSHHCPACLRSAALRDPWLLSAPGPLALWFGSGFLGSQPYPCPKFRGPLGGLRGVQEGCRSLDVGFGSGFRVFLGSQPHL